MKCPLCKLENPPESSMCDCGYDFSKQIQESYNGKALTSMILGIVGLFAWCLPIVGVPIGIIGLILGINSIKSSNKNMAIAGIVLCIICIIASIINGILGAFLAIEGYLDYS